MAAAHHNPGLSVAETDALTRRITWLTAGAALLLLAVKLAAWTVSGSVALLASATDSALDLLASLVTFFAVRYAASPADAEHRYGHGKAEAFASLVQGGLVLFSAALIGREAVDRIFDPRPLAHEGWAVGVMLVSLAVTSLIVLAQSAVVRRTGSLAVAGDRAHYFADFASNLIAIGGIGAAALTERPVLDAAAGLLVAAWLVWSAVRVVRGAARHLMDHELPDEAREAVLQGLFADPAIQGVHQLRTRASGPNVHIQAHVDLDPGLSLMEAHEIVARAEGRLRRLHPAADVILHPDPKGHAEEHQEDYSEEGACRAPARAR
ncbi:MAG: cation diffusion facilitator family transporter [Pseudomonadota bacterium]|nr:cation diffusion facilitator family transporter [Pseudomonadota bacterium]